LLSELCPPLGNILLPEAEDAAAVVAPPPSAAPLLLLLRVASARTRNRFERLQMGMHGMPHPYKVGGVK
jgi:hypothetical protein